MKTTKLFILVFALSLNVAFAQENVAGDDPQAAKSTYLELPWIEVVPIKETKTGRQYELYIKLPEGYDENEDMRYPVLYYTDALWHVEILSSATEYLMENTILAGISWQKDIDQDLVQAQGIHVSRYAIIPQVPQAIRSIRRNINLARPPTTWILCAIMSSAI